ncbi:MAG: tRNA dihydrouridine synthase DusB [Thermoanaerobacteraceae bacterium]|nr:tRNA dihydrouridine synthase DusB [Thermoanaerobacteraceae bacterium]
MEVTVLHKSLKHEIPLYLAPMAGITDLPFRSICKQYGADVLITEMISTRGLIYNDDKTSKLLKTSPNENPIGVQLFGNDPEDFALAIKKIADLPFDFININMGCPTPKIVKNGDGCALMKEPELASKIIKSAVTASERPVSIKIRKGWDSGSINAAEFAIMAETSGASMIMIHGRTREMFYQGKADWDIIKEVKEAVNIPVIGNGDVFTPEDGADMLESTNCDGIMIGRGALGNPWIFREVKHYLNTGRKIAVPSLDERYRTMLLHLNKAISYHGERLGILEMRKHLAWYIKGLPHSAPVKNALQQSKDVSSIEKILEDYFSRLVQAGY